MAEELQTSSQEELVEAADADESPEVVETEPVETEEGDTSEDSIDLVKSERGQKRIQDLANKAKKADELEREVEDLRSKFVEDEVEKTPLDIIEKLRSEGIPYTGDYVQDLQIAEERAAKKALEQFNSMQAKKDRFMADISAIESNYPELSKGSDHYDPDLTDELVTLYKEASNLNPNLRLKTFTDRIMSIRKKSETKGRSVSVQELARQESEGAIRPGGNVKRANKDFKDMTLEELEAIVPKD